MGTVGAGFRYIGHGVLLLADRNRQHNLFPSGHFVSAGFSLQYDCGITVAKDVLLYGYEQCNLKRIAAGLAAGQGQGRVSLVFGRHEEFRIPENHIRRLAYRSLSGGVPAPRLYFPSNGLRFFSGCLLVNRQQPVQDSGGLPFLVQGETAELELELQWRRNKSSMSCLITMVSKVTEPAGYYVQAIAFWKQ